MARQIYRKSLLERMASPDQLDKMIVITSPSFWLAIIGGAVIVATALVWSIVGRLPVKMEANGIFVPDQGAYTLSSDTGGIVASLEVEVGDRVEENTVLLTLADTDMQNELADLYDRRAKVDAVTLESVGDIATADNTDLLNLKTQISATGLETQQQQAMLSVYQAERNELAKELEEAEKEMEKARRDYYAYIRNSSDSEIEIEFSEAQSSYNQYNSIYINAAATADTYLKYYSSVLDAVNDDVQTEIAANQGIGSFTVDQLKEITKKITATPAATAPTDLDAEIKGVIGELDKSGGTYGKQLETWWGEYEKQLPALEAAKEDLDSAKKVYDEAKEDYEDYADRTGKTNSKKERFSALYSEKNNEYQTLYSQMVNLDSNIMSLQGQLKAAQVGASVQSDGYKKQFDAVKAALLSNLDKEIQKYEYSIEKTHVKASVAGTVSDIKVNIGSAVGQGGEVVTIRQFSEENLIVCYIPISSGKKVEPGMEVIVCPTTVNQQEYGHMKATVVEVDNYVASTAGIRSVLGDDMLAQAFTQSGPVVGVTCKLHTDESTASGYWWSNKKGADLMVPEGTLVTVDIITEEKAPISMLVPYVKEKLTMAMEPEAQDDGGGR